MAIFGLVLSTQVLSFRSNLEKSPWRPLMPMLYKKDDTSGTGTTEKVTLGSLTERNDLAGEKAHGVTETQEESNESLKDTGVVPEIPSQSQARIFKMTSFLESAKPEFVPDIELLPMSGDLESPNECIYFKPTTNELGITEIPIVDEKLKPVTKNRRYCMAAIRNSMCEILCTDEEPLRVVTFLGETIELPLEPFKIILETAKKESPYGYEIDYESLIEYIELSENYIYLGTGYFGPLFRSPLQDLVAGKPAYEKIAECNYFEDLDVKGDLVSYAGDKNIFIIDNGKETIWKVDDTVYRLLRLLVDDIVYFIAVTEQAIEIREYLQSTRQWMGESVKNTCNGYLQSFTFIHNGMLVVEEAAGEFVVVDILKKLVEKCKSEGFRGLTHRDHFNRVLCIESGTMYLSMKSETYTIDGLTSL